MDDTNSARSKGERLGAGASAELFAWGTDRVLKLFRREFQHVVDLEAERSLAVHRLGIPAPKVFEIAEVDGRRGIVFERVDGPTLMSFVGPHGAGRVAAALAEVHAAIHRFDAKGLPTLRSLVESALDLDAQSRRASLARIDRMPRGKVVCHGDLHPGNVVITPDGPMILDWVNATAAPAAADVARTLMLIGYQGLSDRTPAPIRDARREMLDAYLSAYLESTRVTRDEVARCEPAMAAALLRAEPDNGEREALRRIVESG